jgi:hypothetical protein
MARVTDSSKRYGAMGVDFLYLYLDFIYIYMCVCVCVCVARGDAPLSGALVFFIHISLSDFIKSFILYFLLPIKKRRGNHPFPSVVYLND